MIDKILQSAIIPAGAGRLEDSQHLDVFAVYFDGVIADGPDDGPRCIFTHNSTVELYATTLEAGDKAKLRFEAELDALSISYTTQGWYWLSSTQRFQEIYELTYINKT